MKKTIFSIILVICIILGSVFSVSAYEVSGFEVTADAAMLVSLDTDEILYSKNADKKIYPASITKLMTAAVILDSCPDLDSAQVTMSDTAYKKILGTGSAVLNAKVGEVFSGKDALAAILISSAGDIVYAFAESTYGSVDAFVEKMNEKASELGLIGTHYQNPIGLHDEQNYTTVNDIKTLAFYVLKNYPIVKEIVSKSRYRMAATNLSDERLLVTTNYMIDSNTAYYYPYCSGLKTGFTDESGRCFVGVASYDGYNYLSITMNCPTVNGTRTEFTTTRQLFRWAFNNFSYKAVLDTSVPKAEIPVRLSSDYDYVSLYPETQIKSILPNEADESSLIIEPHFIAESVDAPIKKGDILGTADVKYAEQYIGTVNLIAGHDVDSSIVLVVLDAIKRAVSSKTFKIIIAIIVALIFALVLYIIILNKNTIKKKRKIRYIPYDEEKEERKKQQLRQRRRKQGRPEKIDFNEDDE